jgi:L-asparaginase II
MATEPMRNPVLIELTRGALVESVHAGAIAVVRADGEVVAAVGDIAKPIFPRSAIKPLQALPFLETGAADRFGFGALEIALACGSHAGARPHVSGVTTMLAGAGLSPAALACGAHEPMDVATAREMVRSGASPTPLNHNCSGKHAAMLATAAHLAEPTEGYWRPDHPVQQRIRRALEDMTGCALGADATAIDGCSVPNWAMPLAGLARAFARLATGEGLAPERAEACQRIREACWAHPEQVAGRGQLVTEVLERLGGRVLVKSGAEGVYCGAFAERGLGFALKIDDGAKRAAEAAVVHVIAKLYPAARRLGPDSRLTNWRGVQVGELRTTDAFEECRAKLPTQIASS